MADCIYPLASLIVVFYNQEQFVQYTIAGALSQTYPNLEIILSDDNSSDNTFKEIQKAIKDYQGPHKIIVNKNEKNMGLVPHINKILFELSNGEFLFLNGGDDISLPERVSLGIKYFLEDPEVTAVTFSRINIDKSGKETGRQNIENDQMIALSDHYYIQQPSFMSKGVALSLKRNVLDKFGPMDNDCQTEDSVLRFRALLLGKTIFCAQKGLKYRTHDNNISRHIYRLKTEPISKQYRKDLESVKNELSPDLYNLISKKIDFYISYRNLQEKVVQSNFLWGLFYKIKRTELILKYKNSLAK